MKKLLFLSSLLSMAVFLFTACGDSRPDDLPVTMNVSAEKSIRLLAGAGESRPQSITFTLDGNFSEVTRYKKWIKGNEALMTSSVEFTGLTDNGIELNNVYIKFRDKQFPLSTTVITSDQKLTAESGPRVNFMQDIVNEIVASNSATVQLEYVPTVDLDANTTFKIKLDVRFSFN